MVFIEVHYKVEGRKYVAKLYPADEYPTMEIYKSNGDFVTTVPGPPMETLVESVEQITKDVLAEAE